MDQVDLGRGEVSRSHVHTMHTCEEPDVSLFHEDSEAYR